MVYFLRQKWLYFKTFNYSSLVWAYGTFFYLFKNVITVREGSSLYLHMLGFVNSLRTVMSLYQLTCHWGHGRVRAVTCYNQLIRKKNRDYFAEQLVCDPRDVTAPPHRALRLPYICVDNWFTIIRSFASTRPTSPFRRRVSTAISR